MVYYSFTECFKLKLRTIWNPYVGWRVGLENELKSGGPNQTALQVFCLLLSGLQFCCMALFGRWQDLRNFGGIDDIRQHFNVADNVWAAFTGVVGDFNNDLRILAASPRTGLLGGCSQPTLLDGSMFNPVQATQIGLVWCLARRGRLPGH